jgi:uncharacterized protein involved in type VI secretion and phage assembly
MNGIDEQTLLEIVERLKSRYYGKYRGTVTEVDDATLRIKAKVPAVLGTQVTGWCTPCVPYAGKNTGLAFLPEVHSGVWIEFEGGDVSYPIWVGGYWRSKEQPADASGKVKAVVTASPLKILFDDNSGSITISDSNQNQVTLDSDGIKIVRGDGSITVQDGKVTINDGAWEVT